MKFNTVVRRCAVVLLSVMNKEILLGDKNHRRPTYRRWRGRTRRRENIFMKSINEFDALLSNRSTSVNKIANEWEVKICSTCFFPLILVVIVAADVINDSKRWMQITDVKVLFTTSKADFTFLLLIRLVLWDKISVEIWDSRPILCHQFLSFCSVFYDSWIPIYSIMLRHCFQIFAFGFFFGEEWIPVSRETRLTLRIKINTSTALWIIQEIDSIEIEIENDCFCCCGNVS